MTYKAELLVKLNRLEDNERTNLANGLTDYLQDQVVAGMYEVQDTVMERITSMRLRAVLTFPEHPLY